MKVFTVPLSPLSVSVTVFFFYFSFLEDATLVPDRCHIQAPLVTFTKRSFVAVKEHTGQLLRRDAHAN